MTVTPTRASATRPGATTRALRVMLRQLLWRSLWFWAIAVAVVVAVIGLTETLGEVDMSVVQFTRQACVWFPFSLMVMLATVYLPVHVAAGLTRRSFARAAVASALVLAAVFALVMTGLLQVERFVFGVQGWPHELTDAGFSATSSEPLRLLLDYALTFAAANLCGLLVGAAYYRLGGWWGTLVLPLTVGPIFLVSPVLAGRTDWAGVFAPAGDGALALRATSCVLVVAMVGAVFQLLARRTQISPVTT